MGPRSAQGLADRLLVPAKVGPAASLKVLDLSWNALGDVGAAAVAGALGRNGVLQRLGLASCSIGNDGALAIADALGRNAALQRLDLAGNHIAAERAVPTGGADDYAPLCARGETGTPCRGARALVDAVRGNSRSALAVLDLRGNELATFVVSEPLPNGCDVVLDELEVHMLKGSVLKDPRKALPPQPADGRSD